MVHGIVDSMWLRKPGAGVDDYERLCTEIMAKLGLPVSLEGVYKWVAFLGSRVDGRIPVLNRYYGVHHDDTFRVRGIELRRHDSPRLWRIASERC